MGTGITVYLNQFDTDELIVELRTQFKDKSVDDKLDAIESIFGKDCITEREIEVPSKFKTLNNQYKSELFLKNINDFTLEDFESFLYQKTHGKYNH